MKGGFFICFPGYLGFEVWHPEQSSKNVPSVEQRWHTQMNTICASYALAKSTILGLARFNKNKQIVEQTLNPSGYGCHEPEEAMSVISHGSLVTASDPSLGKVISSPTPMSPNEDFSPLRQANGPNGQEQDSQQIVFKHLSHSRGPVEPYHSYMAEASLSIDNTLQDLTNRILVASCPLISLHPLKYIYHSWMLAVLVFF